MVDLIHTFLDCRAKPEHRDGTHVGTGRTCKRHTKRPPVLLMRTKWILKQIWTVSSTYKFPTESLWGGTKGFGKTPPQTIRQKLHQTKYLSAEKGSFSCVRQRFLGKQVACASDLRYISTTSWHHTRNLAPCSRSKDPGRRFAPAARPKHRLT